MRVNPNPNCEKEDCRFTYGPMVSTCMAFFPEYNKHGKPVNYDPNTLSYTVACLTCNKHWSVQVTAYETKIEEIWS